MKVRDLIAALQGFDPNGEVALKATHRDARSINDMITEEGSLSVFINLHSVEYSNSGDPAYAKVVCALNLEES
jgi:hypothetical protein